MASDLREYLWIAVLGGICGFFYGFLIGANDVANAFASTVSSKSITLKQAVIIASICEFSGALFLGASVTGTVRSKIFDVSIYQDEPEVLMFGMFTSLLTAACMLFLATHLGLPVSTTHDIVGCIMGFSIAAKGFSSIQWDVVKKIILSWVASPLVSGFIAFLLFGATKIFVLKTDNPYQRAYYAFPVVLFIGIGIDLFFVLEKAATNYENYMAHLHLYWALPVSFGTGFVAGLLWIFVFGRFAKRRADHFRAIREGRMDEIGDVEKPKDAEFQGSEEIEKDIGKDIDEDIDEDDLEYDDEGHVYQVNKKVPVASAVKVEDLEDPKDESTDAEDEAEDSEAAPESNGQSATIFQSVRAYGEKFANATYNQDLRTKSLHENPKAAEIWEKGEVYDPDAEFLFTYVQVFTACLNSFAHGANDVANTIAPTSAIIFIYQNGIVSGKSPVQKWLLAMGGGAIVLGLLLYGYRIMKTLGYKLTILSPSRGACAELGSSLTVVTAAFLGIPVSTTQCITGAISGVALCGGIRNVQWWMLARVCVSWAFLFFIGSILSAGVFSFGAYSPSLSTPVGMK